MEYEKQCFLGNVDVVSGGELKLCCLQKPLKIRKPSEIESESYAVFYKKVFKCEKAPYLCRVGVKVALCSRLTAVNSYIVENCWFQHNAVLFFESSEMPQYTQDPRKLGQKWKWWWND